MGISDLNKFRTTILRSDTGKPPVFAPNRIIVVISSIFGPVDGDASAWAWAWPENIFNGY